MLYHAWNRAVVSPRDALKVDGRARWPRMPRSAFNSKSISTHRSWEGSSTAFSMCLLISQRRSVVAPERFGICSNPIFCLTAAILRTDMEQSIHPRGSRRALNCLRTCAKLTGVSFAERFLGRQLVRLEEVNEHQLVARKENHRLELSAFYISTTQAGEGHMLRAAAAVVIYVDSAAVEQPWCQRLESDGDGAGLSGSHARTAGVG